MTDNIWYYVDRAQQRQGPVTAAEVVSAHAAGQVTDTSLVWRDGLAEWAPLAGFRAELGLAPTTAAAEPVYSPPPAPLPPVAPAKSGKGCLVVGLVVGGLGAIMMIGILAAIAIPAYHDYLARSNVMMALAEGRRHQALVDDFVVNTDRCPRDASELALPPPTSRAVAAITLGEADTGMCTLEIEFGGDDAATLSGNRLVLSRDSAGDWYCTSDFERPAVLPADCQ